MNVNSLSSSKMALTQNGNEYKKSNAGKVIGAVIGAAPMAAGAICCIASGKTKAAQSIGGPIYAALYGLVGAGLGALVDHFIINKSRMTQADGEAALKKQLDKNA